MTKIPPPITNDAESISSRRDSAWRLPRRDLVILPLIFVMTIAILLVGGEVATRFIYVQDDSVEPCEYNTPKGFRYQPLCTSHTKVWEGPWITQHFNECGYRTAESCAPRAAGTLRVAVVGSSTARGTLVNYAESFAGRASAALSARCGQMVDFQNLGTEPTDDDWIDQRIPEALALKPLAIIMTMGAFDVIHLKDQLAAENRVEHVDLKWFMMKLRQSRLFVLMQYYLYRDPLFQIHAFLLNGDPADFVRTPLSEPWKHRVADVGDLFGRITAFTAPAHVPVLLFFVPERAQAAMAGLATKPPGVDPLVLQAALARTAAQHGIAFFDTTKAFASASDFDNLFYMTDGHPREGGHAAIAGVVEHALLAEPAFAACSAQATK